MPKDDGSAAVMGAGTPSGFDCCSIISTVNELEPVDGVKVVNFGAMRVAHSVNRELSVDL